MGRFDLTPKESSSYLQTIGKTLFLLEQLLISTKLSTKRLVSTVANVSSASWSTHRHGGYMWLQVDTKFKKFHALLVHSSSIG
jgi:hypothetical protein